MNEIGMLGYDFSCDNILKIFSPGERQFEDIMNKALMAYYELEFEPEREPILFISIEGWAPGDYDRASAEIRKIYSNGINSSLKDSDNKSTVKCKSCDRTFERSSSDGRSIRKTNMCNNCYSNFKFMIDAVK